MNPVRITPPTIPVLPERPTPSQPAAARSFDAALVARPTEASAPRPAGPLSAAPRTEASPATRALASILDDERRVDRGLAAAMRGASFSPGELIALQANVIRYSQQLDVASKLVEKLTGGIRQVMTTQV